MSRPALAALVLLALFRCGATPAHAQVNVEPLRNQIVHGGFGARARASAAAYAGNTRGVIFGSAALVGLRSDRHLAYLSLSGDYTRLDGAVSVAKWFAHARHNYELSSFLWWEAYAQIESDRFRRVTLRELVGTGPRFGILQGESVEIFYGASYLLEHIDLDTSESGGAAEGLAHRFSNYVALTLRAHQNVVFTSVTYAQPRFDRTSDVNLLSVTSAELVVTERLRSRIDLNVRYASVTPSDVERADLELKNALELVF